MLKTKEDKKLQFIIQAIKSREPIHEHIPGLGSIVFNQIVPYIFIYRNNKEDEDPMISNLSKSQIARIEFRDNNALFVFWVQKIVNTLKQEFGACFIIEAYRSSETQPTDIEFQICQKAILPLTKYGLKNLALEARDITTNYSTSSKVPHANQKHSFYTIKQLQDSNIYFVGLSIKSRYLTLEGTILPLIKRHFRESLAKVLSRMFFEFVRVFTERNPASFKANVNGVINENVFTIDKALTTESKRFDFLLLVTPINSHEEWLNFKKNKFAKAPKFQYRPMPFDPDMVKRNLYNLPIEDIYEPSIAYLFRDKRRELDEMMGMLADRSSEDFVHGSLQIFGNVNDRLLRIAEAILTTIEESPRPEAKDERILNAKEFAQLASQEIKLLKAQSAKFNTSVRVRDDIAGIMVNRGILNINTNYSISEARANALIQHEVGTHIVTYFNGLEQPLQLFSLGVPGYEQLQEGLAVMAEHLVGGLNNSRLRILAARVIAVRHMLMENSFVKTFHLLVDQYHLPEHSAFTITMRVYRGGGLTKDALYLQGLIELITYIKEGNDINLLTVGKIRRDYLPIVEDLIQKGYMNAPKITPTFLSGKYSESIENIKLNGSIFKLIQ